MKEINAVDDDPQRTRRMSLNILDGEDTPIDTWPWVAGLYKVGIGRIGTKPKMLADELPYCAATLISPRYLLTAATCVLFQLPPEMMEKNWVRVLNFTTFQYLVRFGERLVSDDDDPLNADNMVEEIMIYPYRSDEPFRNIAILKLAEPMTFSPSVSPISIPKNQRKLKAGTKCLMIGWKSDKTSISGITNALSKAEITILPKKRCEDSVDFDSGFNICGTSHENQTMQMNDLGGGLYCSEGLRWRLFGITSSITRSGEQIFTSVPAYSDWIAKNTRGTEDDDEY